jgi:hypothetical protein
MTATSAVILFHICPDTLIVITHMNQGVSHFMTYLQIRWGSHSVRHERRYDAMIKCHELNQEVSMNERMYYSHEAAQRAQRERLTIALFSLVMGAGIAALLRSSSLRNPVRKPAANSASTSKRW